MNYRQIYVEHHGSGPYQCVFCGLWMKTLEVCHHKDENRKNNNVSNLEACHRRCHSGHHLRKETAEHREARIEASRKAWKGKKHTDETLKRISALSKRALARHSAEARSKRGAAGGRATKGIPKTEQHKKSQALAQKTTRMRECECGLRTNAGTMAKHQKASGHRSKEQAA